MTPCHHVISLPLSLSLSVSHSVYLCGFVSLTLFISISVPLSLSVSVHPSVFLCVALCLSPSTAPALFSPIDSLQPPSHLMVSQMCTFHRKSHLALPRILHTQHSVTKYGLVLT